MNGSDDLLAEAKRRLSLSGVMAHCGYGDRAKKSARCPFHEDSSASFSVYTGDDGQERFKCFSGCAQGDAIDFLAKLRGLSNSDACREFIRLAGVTPPAPAAPPPATTTLPPPFDWAPCVAALTPEHRTKLAEWRGYSPKLVDWLHGQSLIGLFEGERIALAVHSGGRVIGCHYRINEDGSWRYYPAGTRTAPLIVGDISQAKKIFIFESQWDLFAFLDACHWHILPAESAAAVATRGASNGRLLAGLCPADAYAFAQNDEAGQKWLASVAANSGRKTFQVVTPQPHKDLNDWTRAGAVAADIQKAITEAPSVPTSATTHPPASPPVCVSIPSLPLPETEEDDHAPAFPIDALPPRMASFVAAVSRCERVPPALPAVSALGVVSAAIGSGLEVVSGPNRTTRANLFLLASAESGSGKSETFRILAAPLLNHQTQILEVWRQKTSPDIQSEIRIIDREIASLEKKAAKSADPAERQRLQGELTFKLSRKDDLEGRASMPCIIAQDVTTERLAVILRDNHEVTCSASADARKLVDNLLGRYNPGKTTDESLYLSGYSGDFVRVDRQGRAAVILNKPCLSLAWFIQPDLLATMLDEQSLSTSGFLPRLLVCHTHAAPRKIEGDPQPISDTCRSQWFLLIADLLATFHAASKAHRIEATPEALALLNGFHNQTVDRRSDDLADIGAFASRYAENAWRLSVVFHAAFHGAEAMKHPIAPETAQNAVRVMEWFTAAQLDILAKGRRNAAEKLESEVLELLESQHERKGKDYVTARDVHRARIVSTPAAAQAILSRMECAGILVGEDIKPERGGKSTRLFRVVGGKNPVPG